MIDFYSKGFFDWFINNSNIILLTVIYIGGLSLVLVFLTYDLYSGGNGWKQGDWLINSDVNTIRRGWLGSLFLEVSRDININPIYIVVFIQGIITTSIFFVSWLVGVRLKNNDVAFFLLISPAFIMFWFNDPQGSMRKEILSYFAFLPLIVAALNNKKRIFLYTALSVLIYVVAVFSHEANVFFAPFYVVAIAIIIPKESSFLFLTFLIYMCISAAGLIYALTNSSTSDYMSVCKPILEAGSSENICNGAIRWLEHDIHYALESSKNLLFSNDIYKFLIAYIFSLFIFIYLMKDYFSLELCIITTIISSLCFTPLYVIAIDWGRWINYYVVSLTFLILIWMLAREKELPRIKFNKYKYLILLMFFSSWGVTHVGGYASLKHSYIYGAIWGLKSGFKVQRNENVR